MKKATTTKMWIALAVLGGTTIASSPQKTMAQGTVPSARFSVDLKDATLRDALELVFQAAGNPSHVIDPAASQVRIGSVSFKDQEWRDIVRTLANLNKFSFRRENGLWIVAPRTTSASTEYSPFFDTTLTRSASMRDMNSLSSAAKFTVEARTSRQAGRSGGNSGGNGGGSNSSLSKPQAVDSNNPWSIIEPLHIYAGAIALFFEGGTVITTSEFFVTPAYNKFGNSGDNSGGNNGNSNSTNNTNNSGGTGSGGGFGGGIGTSR